MDGGPEACFVPVGSRRPLVQPVAQQWPVGIAESQNCSAMMVSGNVTSQQSTLPFETLVMRNVVMVYAACAAGGERGGGLCAERGAGARARA